MSPHSLAYNWKSIVCSMLAVYLKSSLCNTEKVDVKLVDVSVNLISTLGLTWWKYRRPHMESNKVRNRIRNFTTDIGPYKVGKYHI